MLQRIKSYYGTYLLNVVLTSNNYVSTALLFRLFSFLSFFAPKMGTVIQYHRCKTFRGSACTFSDFYKYFVLLLSGVNESLRQVLLYPTAHLHPRQWAQCKIQNGVILESKKESSGWWARRRQIWENAGNERIKKLEAKKELGVLFPCLQYLMWLKLWEVIARAVTDDFLALLSTQDYLTYHNQGDKDPRKVGAGNQITQPLAAKAAVIGFALRWLALFMTGAIG